ncbi:hypothetical protein MGWOODY_Smn926 [hydrothermal vent metagenome]|uniref:Uncharacterized protein n=1 Tax=hydrothermal vent metagenome TaxID=652676 RepID=A0A160TM17_9ZZZZ
MAATFGDEIPDLGRYRTKDGAHPQSYADIARAWLRQQAIVGPNGNCQLVYRLGAGGRP